MATPTTQQIRELAAEAMASDKTVRRAYQGLTCKGATIERLKKAAKALGIDPPPEQVG